MATTPEDLVRRKNTLINTWLQAMVKLESDLASAEADASAARDAMSAAIAANAEAMAILDECRKRHKEHVEYRAKLYS